MYCSVTHKDCSLAACALQGVQFSPVCALLRQVFCVFECLRAMAAVALEKRCRLSREVLSFALMSSSSCSCGAPLRYLVPPTWCETPPFPVSRWTNLVPSPISSSTNAPRRSCSTCQQRACQPTSLVHRVQSPRHFVGHPSHPAPPTHLHFCPHQLPSPPLPSPMVRLAPSPLVRLAQVVALSF